MKKETEQTTHETYDLPVLHKVTWTVDEQLQTLHVFAKNEEEANNILSILSKIGAKIQEDK